MTVRKKTKFVIQTDRFERAVSEQNLTQARLARFTGLTEDVLSKLKHGELLIERSDLDILCKNLDCTPEWLIGLSDHRYLYKTPKITQLAILAESLPEHTIEAIISLFLAIKAKKKKLVRVALKLLNLAIEDEVLGENGDDDDQK